MRVSTAFNTMLAIPGSSVTGVSFEPTAVVARVRIRARHPTCPCGRRCRSGYDRSTRRWRHLDLGGTRLYLEAEIRRVSCRSCRRVRTETVPWARPGARHTRDLQDLIAYMAQRMDKTTVTRLLRVSWESVASTVVAVVAENLDAARFHGLFRIGVDEVSYRKGLATSPWSPTTTARAPWCGPAKAVTRPPSTASTTNSARRAVLTCRR